jgi:hypothetical protein
MKKILIGLLVALVGCPSFATGYKYQDRGYFYTNVDIPVDTFKAAANLAGVEAYELKSGTSTSTNILGLVETGNAGVYEAAKNGGISNIHYVDMKKEKIFIPLIFLPVYVSKTITTVYGE